ncbi:MAG: hypothetical protein IRY99_09485 [Isosphaeraceae bacterium]|nr:hypothetical protein [Isosphaeraceae bacterium]
MSDKPELLGQFHDASGKITVAVFRREPRSDQRHYFDFACEVPEDMVAIGGGAEAAELPGGALLTASYPSDDLSAWLASSKDHIIPQPHRLTCYAIGLKIAGMSRQQLWEHLHIAVQDSGQGNYPEASATVPMGHVMVSGGFQVAWSGGAGSLGTASFPKTSFSWTARSKDHEIASPAWIKAYAISLKRALPVGIIQVTMTQQDSTPAAHPVATAVVPPGFALTGAGARVNWQGAGNLLWKIRPLIPAENQGVQAASKDHITSSPATVSAYSLAIKII